MKRIGVIVLAAGRSQRFGSDKREALLGDTPLLLYTVQQYVALRTPIVLVTNDSLSMSLRKQLEQQADLVLLMENPRGSEHNGIGDSLARGIRQAMCAEWDAALIALGDMPWVSLATLHKLKSALATNRAVVPVYDGQLGHPVGFQRRHFQKLSALRGDQGGRIILANAAATELPVTDSGVILDVDTPDQLNRVRQ